jgi:trimeric autotransporter adhesin
MLKKIFFTALLFIAAFANAQNVGIGITTPQSQLHIGDNNINELIIGRNKTSGGFTALYMGTSAVSNGYSYVQSVRSAGSQYGNLILNPFNGNVGIATNNPLFKLDVRGGSINSDGAYYIGSAPILVSPGNFNLFTGLGAGSAITTGVNNTANGSFTLYSNTEGYNNTAVGSSAMFSNTIGYNNAAFGYMAMNLNDGGVRNTSVGSLSLKANVSGINNTAVGHRALESNENSVDNTAIGTGALGGGVQGYQNTAVGSGVLFSNSGFGNTAIGANAFENNYIGNTNTIVGAHSSSNGQNFNNSAALGYATQITASNQARIGSNTVTSIGGYVNWTNISDGRYKKEIKNNVPGLAFITQLQPVTYTLDITGINNKLKLPAKQAGFTTHAAKEMLQEEISAKEKIVYTGFIAQDVEKAAKETGFNFSGLDAPKNENDLYGLRYAEFVVPLVKAVQEQQQLIIQLQKEIEALKIKTNSQK